MPVAKLTASSTSDVMKTEERNDSIDTIIRQAVGKEPFLSFPRVGDSPVQWIQLLQALDQQDSVRLTELQGWPLLSPVKVQLLKCDKCSREFCSVINYRRHMRVQHRMKNLDKDSQKNRDLLGAYWDKLSVEESKQIVSFDNVLLEEVPGSSILKALTTLTQKQAFSSLPQYYLRAGSALLDIVESRPSIFPISSRELFSILDDSSEKTFLCGIAVSMQRYIFYGEAGKIGLEEKNIVACTSFFLEQKLVEAWLAGKEAEALRCQKLLVEEEEAAQRRQAEVLERKRQKKLRQNEQKVRERIGDDTEIKGNSGRTVGAVSYAEASWDSCGFEADNPDTSAEHAPSPPETCHCPDTNEVVDRDINDCETEQHTEHRTSQGHNRRRMVLARWQGLPKSQWAVSNGLHASSNSQTSKVGVIQKYGTNRDQRAASFVNGVKVWSRKPKPEANGVVSKAMLVKEPEQGENYKVLIGSISVTLGNSIQSEGNFVTSKGYCLPENLAKQTTAQEKPMEPDSFQSGSNRLTDKLWRPVGQHGTKDSLPLQSGGAEDDAVYGKDDKKLSGSLSSSKLYTIDRSAFDFVNKLSHLGAKDDPGSFRLSNHAAKAFLAQRWKEAISSNHVKLILSPDSEPPGRMEVQDCELETYHSSHVDPCSILANAENRLPVGTGVPKSKTKMKPKKGMKIKYIPRQKAAT